MFPFRKIKVKFKETIVLPRIIPREEIEQLLNYMYAYLNDLSGIGYKHGLRDAAVVELFFATGARVYEISNIRSESINLNSGLIRIMGKGGKERYIQISNEAVLVILRKYYVANECRNIWGVIFVSIPAFFVYFLINKNDPDIYSYSRQKTSGYFTRTASKE